ncbi:ADP-ribosylation factor-like protein 4A [Macrotis lagotis]|uniref:ADP-ribosylation factor-like protein 4A n=1 Tax=Macrotis lagotis TaxID=92651 RepID=UPI003D687965
MRSRAGGRGGAGAEPWQRAGPRLRSSPRSQARLPELSGGARGGGGAGAELGACARGPPWAAGPGPRAAAAMGNGLSEPGPGLLGGLAAFRRFHIVILGLDCAGKTTVLYRLQLGEFVNTVPTKGFNAEKVRVTLGGARTVTFHFWDVGGQEKLRPLWKSYTRRTDGIVFVVDSVDVERLDEAKTELHRIARLPENQGVPLLLVANKQDLRHSLPPAELARRLALAELAAATPWHLQPTCAIIGDGLREGLDKLHQMILRRRKTQRQQRRKR